MVGWHHQLSGHECEQAPGILYGPGGWHAVVHGVAKSWTQLSDWIELNWIISDGEHIFICLLAIYLSCMMNCLFKFSAQFLIELYAFFFFFLLSCMSYLYILEINPLLVTLFANNFSHFIGCPSFCLWFPLLCKSCCLIRSQLFIFVFHYSRRCIQKDIAVICVKECSVYVFPLGVL